jgi:hypothetical protein
MGLANHTFISCYSLKKIIIPEGVSLGVGNNSFVYCLSLNRIVFPKDIGSIGTNLLQYCESLTTVVFPENVTTISQHAFSGIDTLSSIVFPAGVTSIGAYAFHNCHGMKFYDFTQHTAVPTLSATSAFTNIPSDCEIRVPAALYDEWIAATNWSTYADYIVAV